MEELPPNLVQGTCDVRGFPTLVYVEGFSMVVCCVLALKTHFSYTGIKWEGKRVFHELVWNISWTLWLSVVAARCAVSFVWHGFSDRLEPAVVATWLPLVVQVLDALGWLLLALGLNRLRRQRLNAGRFVSGNIPPSLSRPISTRDGDSALHGSPRDETAHCSIIALRVGLCVLVLLSIGAYVSLQQRPASAPWLKAAVFVAWGLQCAAVLLLMLLYLCVELAAPADAGGPRSVGLLMLIVPLQIVECLPQALLSYWIPVGSAGRCFVGSHFGVLELDTLLQTLLAVLYVLLLRRNYRQVVQGVVTDLYRKWHQDAGWNQHHSLGHARGANK